MNDPKHVEKMIQGKILINRKIMGKKQKKKLQVAKDMRPCCDMINSLITMNGLRTFVDLVCHREKKIEICFDSSRKL